MSDERDPGDEDETVEPWILEDRCCPSSGRLISAAPIERRRLTEPRGAALRDIDSTWRRTGRR